jgi:hypothetical protein
MFDFDHFFLKENSDMVPRKISQPRATFLDSNQFEFNLYQPDVNIAQLLRKMAAFLPGVMVMVGD